ncbi:Uma2 family endonuclease [Limnothrix sp. FACHB-1083]|uniref:Uma2 family endonuclease n=1 Tax=unclassified Limnothrix TaxID=2632864 RepID=UPI001680D3BF|nr:MULTISPECIES: Uma2 family endonuclease [unclassified Limnothrix]MBD2160322.1 Uma2 family endonuclease [Limnothrix sp. FACHB-1083]MBD2191024.1 Uma2 family endonuclease [Limnothrix sp. FACHB-1088]
MIAIPNYINPDEYLIIERDSSTRHEYRRGLVYAMAGGSDSHARIAINLLSAINLHLGDTDCRFYNGDVKVSYADEFYYYPDAFVTCDPRDRADRYIKRHPKLIVEVLSQSTRAFDLGQKFEDYRQIPDLEEYVLIDQDQHWVECRRRQPDNTWTTVIYGTGDQITLQSINLTFPLEQLYRGLD